MWHERAGTQLVEPGDRHFWKALWRTDAFRSLLDDPRTGYARLIEQASRWPWWFVDPKHSYERRHFSVWFGHTFIRRTYDNPVITDLFYWHDLLHALTMRDGYGLDESAWQLAMRANEIAVSLETEVMIYWRATDLRPQTFPQPIWFDHIRADTPALRARLQDYSHRLALNQSPQDAWYEHQLRRSRIRPWPLTDPTGCPWHGTELWDLRRAMTHRPSPSSPVEQDLARYEAMSNRFFHGWRDTWREVESQRYAFASLCQQGRWHEAVQRRQDHWMRCSNDDGVPYGKIALSMAD